MSDSIPTVFSVPKVFAQERRPEIVVIRQVPPRSAVRKGNPGPALIVRTAPNVDLSSTRRIEKLVVDSVASGQVVSDAEAAVISAAVPLDHPLTASTQIGQGSVPTDIFIIGEKIPALGAGGAVLNIGPQISSAVRSGAANLTGATSGLGSTITNAVSP